MGKDMVSQSIWIAIVIGVFFVGIGVSYAIFSDSPTQPNWGGLTEEP